MTKRIATLLTSVSFTVQCLRPFIGSLGGKEQKSSHQRTCSFISTTRGQSFGHAHVHLAILLFKPTIEYYLLGISSTIYHFQQSIYQESSTRWLTRDLVRGIQITHYGLSGPTYMPRGHRCTYYLLKTISAQYGDHTAQPNPG